MAFTVNFHRAISAKSDRADSTTWLRFDGQDNDALTVFMPRHVADATAKVFNRAMQAKKVASGYVYDTPVGSWHISPDPVMGRVWQCQHDDAEPGYPARYFTEGRDLFSAMDAIDDEIDMHACGNCDNFCGDAGLEQVKTPEGEWRFCCDDCIRKWNEDFREETMAMEAAKADRADAVRKYGEDA